MKLGHFVEIEITRQKFPVEVFGQQHEFHVDGLTRKLRKFRVVHREVDAFGSPDPIENVQSSPATNPLEFVGTVCDGLEFHQHKTGHDQTVVEDVGFGKLRKPPVDDAARVEHQWLDPLKVPCEFHVGDHETKVVLGL